MSAFPTCILPINGKYSTDAGATGRHRLAFRGRPGRRGGRRAARHIAAETLRHARDAAAGRAAAARRQRRVPARWLRLSAPPSGAGHPLPGGGRHPDRYPRPLDQLRPWRRVVRERARQRVRAGRDGPRDPVRARHGASNTNRATSR